MPVVCLGGGGGGGGGGMLRLQIDRDDRDDRSWN